MKTQIWYEMGLGSNSVEFTHYFVINFKKQSTWESRTPKIIRQPKNDVQLMRKPGSDSNQQNFKKVIH